MTIQTLNVHVLKWLAIRAITIRISDNYHASHKCSLGDLGCLSTLVLCLYI